MKKIALTVIVVLFALNISAQNSDSDFLGQNSNLSNAKNRKESINFVYSATFESIFNNLESCSPWDNTRTLFGAKIAPQIGFEFNKFNRVMVGADLLQDFGYKKIPTSVDYTLYYQYKNKNLLAAMGAIPFFEKSIASYPLTFFSDETHFYNPNIEGVLFSYQSQSSKFKGEFFVDWNAIDRAVEIDRFSIGGYAQYNMFDDLLGFNGAFMLMHDLNNPVFSDCYLFEQFRYSANITTNLASKLSWFSNFKLSFGTLSSSENKRILDVESKPWITNVGWNAELLLTHKGFGIKNSYYFGDGQFHYWNEFGGASYYDGLCFYQSRSYNRTDLFYGYKTKYLTIRGDMVFHITSKGVANQQMITLKVDIEQLVKRKRNDR